MALPVLLIKGSQFLIIMSQLLPICLAERTTSLWSLKISLILRMGNLLAVIDSYWCFFSGDPNSCKVSYPASLNDYSWDGSNASE